MFESTTTLLQNLCALAVIQIICQCIFIGVASKWGHLCKLVNGKVTTTKMRYKSLVASVTVNAASILIIYLTSLIFGIPSIHIPVVMYLVCASVASIANICFCVYMVLWDN